MIEWIDYRKTAELPIFPPIGPPPPRRHEVDEQRLFTEACLHGLRARLCDDVESLDGYLPPRVAQLARKVATVLEEPQPAAT
ncbi:hypothetical protein ABZ697_27290 [Streptomyces albidoflavus]|uniref:hypothetical protein n=1 Tax=Streptomyces albidoflavus TaxID=1886 RepID=UPI0033336922